MLVHESECKLLDRALAFGDVVKKSLTSETSGTVISVDVTVGLRHAYFDPANPERCYSDLAVEGVPEAEVELATPWNEGDFVIYKGAWMGVVRAIDAEVTMKLRDDSVVVVEDPGLLDIPVPDSETPGSSGAPPQTTGAPGAAPRTRPNATSGTPKRQETVSGLHNLTAGQMITTTKANLRRGRWIYGQYNASIPPTGTIVEAKPSRLSVAWLCQNVMVPGRFVPMPEPDSYVELLEEENNLNKFHKSTGGYKAADGRRFTKLSEVQSGGELQVGDRVRFRDLEQAIGKYNVKKIPRNEVLGYEVNVFIVYETKTQVRIQWQDGTESLHDACSLVSYLNVDDHDVWPGEIVVMKSETSLSNEVSAMTRIQAALPGILAAARYGPVPLATPLPDMNPTKSEKIGVVESVEPPARLARVRWFKSPDIQVSAGYTMAGSTTGELEAEAEDVSLYEVVAHHALALRRGDIVLIAPPPPPPGSAPAQEPEDTDMPDLVSPSWELNPANPNNQTPPPNLDNLTPRQLEILTANLAYGATVEARFASLVDAVGRPEHPLYPVLNEMLESFPRLVEHEIMPRRPEAAAEPVHNPMDTPPEWVGEVVDLGMDGLVTVRLGALDELKEVRVPIERLHVVHTEDMDLPGEDELMGEDSDSDMSDEMPELIEVTYEGGEPADTGMDEDWLTDEEEDDTIPWAADPDVPEAAGQQSAASEPIARTPPPIPENIPPPEAITLPESSSTPPRFEMLDTPVPTDHALLSQPSVATSPAFTRRVMREYKILASSLPEGIFVRTWESRLDLFRVLILGPLNTPYELAPFLFDFYFPATFPTDPPQAYFHSWTNGIGRVNPNLYDDGTGKVCLSLLGTWHADERGEGWSASRSTILQVLVSLMGLVLVREPWYSEYTPSSPRARQR